mgnify:CR=1 FL=1
MALTAFDIKMKLLTDDRWLYRAVYVIYERQTTQEKLVCDTKENNGIGFNSVDGKALSEIAERIIAGKTLTAKQLAETRRRMLKYVNQLRDIAAQKECAK